MICDADNAGVGNLSNFLYSYLLVLERTLLVFCTLDSNFINCNLFVNFNSLEKYPVTATNSSSLHAYNVVRSV